MGLSKRSCSIHFVTYWCWNHKLTHSDHRKASFFNSWERNALLIRTRKLFQLRRLGMWQFWKKSRMEGLKHLDPGWTHRAPGIKPPRSSTYSLMWGNTFSYCLSHFEYNFLLHKATSFLPDIEKLNRGDPVRGTPWSCATQHLQGDLPSEAQERGQAGDTDLMTSDEMSTENADETDQGKHTECGKGRWAGPRTELWEILALGGL